MRPRRPIRATSAAASYSVLSHDSIVAAGIEPIGDWRERWLVAAPEVLAAPRRGGISKPAAAVRTLMGTSAAVTEVQSTTATSGRGRRFVSPPRDGSSGSAERRRLDRQDLLEPPRRRVRSLTSRDR